MLNTRTFFEYYIQYRDYATSDAYSINLSKTEWFKIVYLQYNVGDETSKPKRAKTESESEHSEEDEAASENADASIVWNDPSSDLRITAAHRRADEESPSFKAHCFSREKVRAVMRALRRFGKPLERCV